MNLLLLGDVTWDFMMNSSQRLPVATHESHRFLTFHHKLCLIPQCSDEDLNLPVGLHFSSQLELCCA